MSKKFPQPSSALPATHDFGITNERLQQIYYYPHLLGHIAGKTKLKPVHSAFIRYIWTSTKPVAMMCHRGSFKSTSVSEIGIVWYLLFNPNARICLVRKTYTDAAQTIEAVGKIFDLPEVREIFYYAHGEYPEFAVRKEGVLSFSFKKTITVQASVTGFGVNSQIIGQHFDRILCDDISTRKDRLFRAERENTKAVWRELSTNVIDRDGNIMYIGTPWAPDGVESILPQPILKFSIEDVGLIDDKKLEEIRSKTIPSEFAANYLLEFISNEDAPYADLAEKHSNWQATQIESVRAVLDAAYGGEDLCALTIMAKRFNGEIQVAGFSYAGSIADWLDTVVSLCKKYKVKKLAVEHQGDKGWTAAMLRSRGLIVEEFQETMQKDNKIATYISEVWKYLTFDNDSDLEYLAQIQDWMPGVRGHDDAPDSLACCIRKWFSSQASHISRWSRESWDFSTI
jgi:hypothetical protein